MKTKRRKLFILGGINIALLLGVGGGIIAIEREISNKNFDQNLSSTKSLNFTRAQALEPFLTRQFQTTDNLSQFIDGRELQGSSSAAIDIIRNLYDYSDLEYHLVSFDPELYTLGTTRGCYRIIPSEDSEVFYPVYDDPEDPNYPLNKYGYENYDTMFRELAAQVPNLGRNKSRMCWAFDNPYTYEKSYAVYNLVNLYDQGELKSYILLQVDKRTTIENILKVNPEEEESDSSIMVITDSRGNYLYKSNHNFAYVNVFDYIEDKNPGVDLSLDEDFKNGTTYKILVGPKSKQCIYYSLSLLFENRMTIHVMSITPVDNFKNSTQFELSYLLIIVPIIFIALIDTIYLSNINKALRSAIDKESILNEKLVKTSKAKSDFLSSMSHDIRTPMNAIIGMTTIAKKRLNASPTDKEGALSSLDKIEQSSSYLLTLINDILDISKIEEGKVTLNPSVFNLSEMMDSIISVVKSQYEFKNQDFETFSKNIKHEYVFADELRLKQIYLNILSNAIKYTDSNGKIIVSLEEEELDDPSKVRVIFKVEDNGIGMSEEFVKHIFDRFSRAVDLRIDKIQGTGLGMSITKEFVDLMGGNIEVESKLNVGSKFIVTLDLNVAEATSNYHTISFDNLSCLVIDDDLDTLDSTKAVLEGIGFKVSSADNGYEGIRIASENHQNNHDFDVIFIDWKMPKLSGLETMKSLRKIIKSSIPIIIVTAYDYSDVEQECKALGATGFISKPVFKYSLVRELSKVLLEEEAADVRKDLSLNNLRILYAEDNDFNFEIVQEIFADEGVGIERAHNGEECVNKLINEPANRYDVIFMDIQMPIKNGYEATKEIRELEDKSKADIPIYAVTADAFMEDIERAKASGMNGHLTKPIDIKKVEAILQEIKENKEKESNGN